MKAKDIRAMSDAELRDELVDLRREQFNLRMQRATGQTTAWARFRQARREIARIKTIISERERAS